MIFQKVFSDVFLDHSCVPVFFFISGYLFFIKYRFFGVEDYKIQLCKRFNGLAVPYCIANLIYFIVFCLLPKLKGNHIGINIAYDFMASFWSYNDTNIPIDGPLWYIRDLLVLSFLSPVIYYVIMNYKSYAFIGLCGLWGMGIWFDEPGFSCYPYVFFSLGSCLAIHGKDIVAYFKSFFLMKLSFFYPLIILFVSYIGFKTGDKSSFYILSLKIAQLISVPFWFSVVILLSKYVTISKKWVTATFFVFLYHYSFSLPSRIIYYCNLDYTNGTFFATYLTGTFIEVALLLIVYNVLNIFLPRLLSIMVGGR